MYQSVRAMAFLAVSILVFSLVFSWGPSAPRYFPLENSWRWGSQGEGPGMLWYGRTGVAFVPGLLAGVIAGWGAGRLHRAPWLASRGGGMLIAGVVLVALLVAMGVIIYEQLEWFGKAPT